MARTQQTRAAARPAGTTADPSPHCYHGFTELFDAFGTDDPTKIRGELAQASGRFLEQLASYWELESPRREDLPYFLSRLTP